MRRKQWVSVRREKDISKWPSDPGSAVSLWAGQQVVHIIKLMSEMSFVEWSAIFVLIQAGWGNISMEHEGVIPLARSLFTSEEPLNAALSSQVCQQICSVFSDGYCGHLNWIWSRTYRRSAEPSVGHLISGPVFEMTHTARPCFPSGLTTMLWDRKSVWTSCELGTILKNQLSNKLDL